MHRRNGHSKNNDRCGRSSRRTRRKQSKPLVLINHIQYPHMTNGIVYCHHLQAVVEFGGEHYGRHCMGPCPYYVGNGYQSDGIECQYYDHDDEKPTHVISSRKQVHELKATSVLLP